MMDKVKTFFMLSEEDQKQLKKKHFQVTPNVCFCDDLIVMLKSDGTVLASGNGKLDARKWTNIIKICNGSRHIVGLKSNGKVVAFGDNTYHQCDVASWENVQNIFAKDKLTVGITNNDEILITGSSDTYSDEMNLIEQNALKLSNFMQKTENNLNNLSKQIDNRCASLEIEMAEQISKELIDFMQKMYSSLKKLSSQIDKQSMDTIQLHKDVDSLKKQVENIKEDMLKCSKLNKFSENILLQPVQPEGLKIVTKTEKLSNLPPQQSSSDPNFNQTDYVKQLKRQMYAGSIANNIPKNLCYGCMKVNNGEAICPYCGFDKNYKQATPYLPLGTKLKNGNYIIGKKVSSNAEGAKYISYSKDIQIPVIIEEFMPIVMIGRAGSQTCIWVKQGFEKKYKTLQREFIHYYYTLPEILNVFNENNTSYVVTKIYDSVSLREYLKEHGNLDWNAAKSLFMPLISDIKFLHKKKIGHYAISPDNVIITNNGKIKLSNFAIEEMRKAGGFLDPELTDGFAAPEQYEKFTDLDESTDVYGLSATLLYALAGITLKNANERHANENINFPQWLLEKIPSNVIMAISKGLALKKSDRIQTFGELCTYFDAYKTTSFKYLMYRVGGNEICLIEYIDNRSEVVIPSEIDNKFVKGLVGTFQNCKNLKNVMIPDSINFIGERTFYGCRILRDVYIPNSVVSIADDAFGSCDIRLTIHGEKDSYAEKYAKEKHFKFIETD